MPNQIFRRIVPTLLLFSALALSFGCRRHEVEGYRVDSYDAVTGRWVLPRNGTFDGKYLTKRLVVVCDFYKWGQREAVVGSTACNLRVGQMMVPNPLPGEGKRSEFLDIWEMSPDRLSITEGTEDDLIMQQFIILREEVVND
jgi:hypothetical protein